MQLRLSSQQLHCSSACRQQPFTAARHHCLSTHQRCRQSPARRVRMANSSPFGPGNSVPPPSYHAGPPATPATNAPQDPPTATTDRLASSAVMAPDSHASASPWYAWPEGYLGQSFNLAGKLEPRATALRDDVDELTRHSTTRREEAHFSEHTITSAEESAMMVSAVVGADVDMGLLKVGGSASFEMYQNYKRNCISHNMVASFQQNHTLEKNQLALSLEARQVLKRLGPEQFEARYGTHFVCGVGYRGAFIGSINIQMQESSNSYAAGVSFKASYGACSATADIKGQMKDSGIDCEVSVEWSKWGVDDDGSLDELEENCAEQNPSLTAIRQLAIQTADRATGYPKLIKLRPYSTLPDFVEACNESGQPLPQLLDQDPVLAYLTDRYRRVAYVLSALEQESRSGVGLNVSRLELKTRMLLAQLEEAFTDKPTLQVLSAYFKELAPTPTWSVPPAERDALRWSSQGQTGRELVAGWDTKILPLDLELFKKIHKPLCLATPHTERLYDSTTKDGVQIESDALRSVHIASVSSSGNAGPFGGWWLNGKLMESTVVPGFYVAILGNYKGRFQQVGATRRFDTRSLAPTHVTTNVNAYLTSAKAYQSEANTIIVTYKVGDGGGMAGWSTAKEDTTNIREILCAQVDNNLTDLAEISAWATIAYKRPPPADDKDKVNTRGVAAARAYDSMVMAEAVLRYHTSQ